MQPAEGKAPTAVAYCPAAQPTHADAAVAFEKLPVPGGIGPWDHLPNPFIGGIYSTQNQIAAS